MFYQKSTAYFPQFEQGKLYKKIHRRGGSSPNYTALKKRLTQYTAKYPSLCWQTDDDEQGGLTFEIDRRRLAVRLTTPYSDEQRKAASELTKKNGLKGRV